MSTLSVSNITDGTDTVETGYVVNGSAKAWVNFDGTGTIIARDSFNVASLTDRGTGAYDVNFSSNMSNDDFITSGFSNNNGASDNFNGNGFAALGINYSPMTGTTVSGTSVGGWVSGTGYTDGKVVYAAVHGELA